MPADDTRTMGRQDNSSSYPPNSAPALSLAGVIYSGERQIVEALNNIK